MWKTCAELKTKIETLQKNFKESEDQNLLLVQTYTSEIEKLRKEIARLEEKDVSTTEISSLSFILFVTLFL